MSSADKKRFNARTIEQYWRVILKSIGEDPEREGLKRTPYRIARMYKEVFRGYAERPPKITVFKDSCPEGLIIDKGYYFSMCEHHIVPFFGDYYFGYIPNKCYMGASKIGRTVDYYSARLQTAERLCSQVSDRIEEVVKPHGLILIMTGRHLCKEMRGVKKVNSPFEAIEARGVFLRNTNGCKDEFMARLGSRI